MFKNEYEKMSIVTKAGLWFTFCNILQQGISVITTPLFTRLLTTEEYGIVSLYQTWFNIIVVIVTLQIYINPLNNAMVKFSDNQDKIVSCMQGMLVTMCAMSMIAFALLRDVFILITGLPEITLAFLLIQVYGTASMSLWMSYNRFHYRYKSVVITTLAYAIINAVLGLALVIFMRNGWLARIISLSMSQFVFGGVLSLVNLRGGKTFFDLKLWKYSFTFGVRLLPNSLASLFLNQADRIVIQKLTSTVEVAYYSLAYNIATLTEIFKNAISHAFLPWMYTNLKEGADEDVQKKISTLNWVMFGIVASFLLIMPELLMFMGGERYMVALEAIPPIACSVVVMFMSTPLSNIQYYFNKVMFGSVVSISVIGLNFWLNFEFIPCFGYVAAGYTTFFSYSCCTVLNYLYLTYILKKEQRENIISGKHYLIFFGLCILLMLVTGILYEYTLIRYFVILIILIFVIIYHKRLIGYIKLN